MQSQARFFTLVSVIAAVVAPVAFRSAFAQDFDAPATPQGAAATVTPNGVVLSWTANPETDIAGYTVTRGGDGEIITLTNPITPDNQFTDATVTSGLTYRYTLRAIDTAGNPSGFTQPVTIAIPAGSVTPPPVAGTRADSLKQSITVSWMDYPRARGYKIDRAAASGPFIPLATVPNVRHFFIDDSAPAGMVVRYVVRAVLSDGTQTPNSSAAENVASPKPVLLVDADSSSHDDRSYSRALAGAGRDFDVWTIAIHGTPLPRDLLQYAAIVWHAGSRRAPAVTPEEIHAIRSYLARGGAVFLTSRHLLEGTHHGEVDFMTGRHRIGPFAEEDLGIVPPFPPPIPLRYAATAAAAGPDYAGLDVALENAVIPDPDRQPYFLFQTTGGSHGLLGDPSGSFAGSYAAIARESAGRIVYWAFGLEDLASQSAGPELIDRTLTWLQNAPLPLWTRPSEGAVGVGTDTLLDVGLRVPLERSSLAGNVVLVDAAGTPVSATIDYHALQNVIRVAPQQNLAATAAYALRILDGLRDIHGRPLGPSEIRFRTGAAPASPISVAPSAPEVDRAGTHNGHVALRLPARSSTDATHTVVRREHGQVNWMTVNDGPIRSTIFIDDTAIADVFYDYALAEENSAGVRGPLSSAVSVRSRDMIPPALTIATPAPDLYGFHRTRASAVSLSGAVDDPRATVTVNGNPTPVNGTAWTVSGVTLASEGLNAVAVRASDPAGNVAMETLRVIRDNTAKKPGPLTANPVAASTMRLEWPFSGETDLVEHRIERRPANAPNPATAWQQIARTPVPAMFHEDAAIAEPSCYRLKSIDNFANESSYSDEVCPVAFGAGIANRVGRSYDPITGVDEVPVRIGTLPPLPVVPNQVGVRYVNSTGYEWDGPPYELQHHHLPSVEILIENSSGFGPSGTIAVKLPPGLEFDVAAFAGSTFGLFNSFGTYPENPPGHVPASPHWDTTRTYESIHPDFTLVSAAPDEVRLTYQTRGHVIGSDSSGTAILSGPANLKGLLLWEVRYRRMRDGIDWQKVRDPFLPVDVTVNGTVYQASFRYQLDRDPRRRASLQIPVDDRAGYVNTLTGDYSFSVPLFNGEGVGLNVNGALSYSSRRAIFDRAGLRRQNHSDYVFAPLGPGWRYPYGLKIVTRTRRVLENGQFRREEPQDLLLIAPGGEHFYFGYKDYTANPLVHEGETYLYGFEPTIPLIAQIDEPLILPRAGGGYWLVEARPHLNGFTRYEFDDQGRLTRILPHGGAAPLEITYAGNVQEVRDSSGRVTKFTFGSGDRIERIDDPAGGVWLLSYDNDALISIREEDTGYGWQFAYDTGHRLLTERQLPHGFTLQSHYDTADSLPPERFLWASLASTEWKEIPNTRRTIRYRRGFGSAPDFPDRVSINSPSGRNTLHYDFHVDNLLDVSGSTRNAQVLLFDQDENNPATVRALGRRESWTGLRLSRDEDARGAATEIWNHMTVALSTHPTAVQFPDRARITQPSGTGGATMQSPSQIAGVSGFARFVYFDPGTRSERLKASYPAGHDPADANAKHTGLEYDARLRPTAIRSVHGYTTRLVYASAPNDGQVHTEIRCAGEVTDFTATIRDPYRWIRTYDALGRLRTETDPDGFTISLLYDKAGRVIEQRGPEHPVSTIDVPILKLSYDGELITSLTVTQSTGGEVRKEVYLYDPRGRLIEKQAPQPAADGSPSSQKYEYDHDGNLRFHRWPSSAGESTHEFVYDNRGNVVRMKGPEGETTEFDYDERNFVVQIREIGTGPARVWDIVDRDAMGRELEVELPEVTQGGATARPKLNYLYNDDGTVRELKYSFVGSERKTTFEYDAFSGLTRQVLEMGSGQKVELAYARDDVGKLLQTKGPALTPDSIAGPIVRQTGRTRRSVVNVETDCFGDVIRLTDLSRDERLSIGRDLRGVPSTISQPDPSREQNTSPAPADTPALQIGLDALGLPAGTEDVFGNRTKFTRDIYKREMRMLTENGAEVASVYNADGDLAAATIRLPEGGVLAGRITYDAAGNTMSIEGPGGEGSHRRFQYDKAGRVTRIIDSEDKETVLEYDDYGDLKRKSLANGRFADYERDAMGRIVAIRESDAAGTVWKTTRWEYDAFGNLAVQDDGHFRSESTFDKLGRITRKTMAIVRISMTETLEYTWGEYGNLVSVKDSGGYVLLYTWDNEDNLIDVTVTAQGLDHTLHRNYDRAGKLHHWEYRNGTATLVSAAVLRDRKGRLTELRYDAPDSQGVQARYEYDGMDRIVSAEYAHKNVVRRFAYDGRGYLIGEEWSAGDGTPISKDVIEYDEGGNRVRRTRDGRATSYHHDRLDRLVVVEREELLRLRPADMTARADSEFSSDFEVAFAIDGRQPDSLDPRTAWRSAATDVEHWVELDLGTIRPVAAIDVSFPTTRGGIDKLQVEWRDPVRGLVEVVQPAAVYHGARRDATTMTTRQHTIRLVLSPPLLTQHLRVTIPRGGTARSPVTLAQELDVVINEISVYVPDTSRVVQVFDDAGFLIRSGSTTFDYDTEGRLTRMQGPGVHRSWAIGPNGLPVSETDHLTAETRYFFNNGPNVFAEFVASSPSATPRAVLKHVSGFGPDTHLGFVSYDATGTPSYHWLFREGPGSIAQVRDANGALLDDDLTNAWGEPVIPSMRVTDHPYGFAGRRELPNGLYDLRGRVYDPSTGRFISRDPIGFAQGGNLYAYGANDPVNAIDLMGLIPWRQRAEAFAGVFWGAGRALYQVGEGAGTVVVGGAAKLLGVDRNGYFADVIRKHDQMVEGLAEKIAGLPETISDAVTDPTTLAEGVLNRFENAVAAGDAFEAAAVLGETTMHAAMAIDNAAASVGRTMNLVARARKARPFAKVPCMRGSFRSGTPVLTPAGPRPIESIAAGDVVMTRDDVSGVIGQGMVLAVHRRDAEAVIRVQFKAGGERAEIETTPEHPFWVEEEGWIPASALRSGQRVFSRLDGSLEITSVTRVEGRQPVFNLTVKDSTFFVGGGEVWVHNLTPCQQAAMLNMLRQLRRDLNTVFRRHPNQFTPGEGTLAIARITFRRSSGLAPEYVAAYSGMSRLRRLRDTRGMERRLVTPHRDFMRSASRRGTAESYVDSPLGRYPHHVEPKLLDHLIEHVNFDDIHSVTLLIERMPCGASCGVRVLPSWADGIPIEGGRFIPLRGPQGRFMGTRSIPLEVYHHRGRGRLEEW